MSRGAPDGQKVAPVPALPRRPAILATRPRKVPRPWGRGTSDGRPIRRGGRHEAMFTSDGAPLVPSVATWCRSSPAKAKAHALHASTHARLLRFVRAWCHLVHARLLGGDRNHRTSRRVATERPISFNGHSRFTIARK